MSAELTEAWNELAHERPTGNGWMTRRLAAATTCAVRAAISHPSGMRALLLEVAARSIDNVVEYPSARGFEVYPETITPGPGGTVRLCLVLSDPAHVDEFSVLADDVVAAIAQAHDEAIAFRAFIRRLYAWQAFLRKHRDGLSLEEQTGLFAELTFLREILGNYIPASQLLLAWRGPTRSLRDFVVGPVEVEIKATASAAASTFQVSHLAQLDDIPSGTLILAHYRLAETASGQSLPGLIEGVRQHLKQTFPDGIPELDQRLMDMGYIDAHARLYQGRLLSVRGVRFFHVSEGFPRLRPSSVPHGVVDASYAVDLLTCFPYEIDVNTFTSLLSSAAGENSVHEQ
ncbi:MAG: PD-(D/E)XK motif protein [Hyphomicrobium sp.]